MRRSLALPGACVIAGAALGPAATADINPMAGTQRLTGATAIRVNGTPVLTGGFDLQAPDPMGSWMPPTQTADLIGEGSFVELESSFFSSISPAGVVLSTITFDQAAGHEPANSTAEVEFSAMFDLSFSIDVAGLYTLSASIQRAAAPLDAAAIVRFGAEGHAPIVDLVNAGGPWPPGVDVAFPETTIMLEPGVYAIHVLDEDARSGGPHTYLHHSKIDFSLTVVPAPGPMAIVALGLLAWARRRR